jgi:hypothetical protein
MEMRRDILVLEEDMNVLKKENAFLKVNDFFFPNNFTNYLFQYKDE